MIATASSVNGYNVVFKFKIRSIQALINSSCVALRTIEIETNGIVIKMHAIAVGGVQTDVQSPVVKIVDQVVYYFVFLANRRIAILNVNAYTGVELILILIACIVNSVSVDIGVLIFLVQIDAPEGP